MRQQVFIVIVVIILMLLVITTTTTTTLVDIVPGSESRARRSCSTPLSGKTNTRGGRAFGHGEYACVDEASLIKRTKPCCLSDLRRAEALERSPKSS